MAYISVLIPLYNNEELIIRALDSIPIRDDLEIVVANDCSTDNSLEKVLTYKRLKIKVLNFKNNHGIGFIRNSLIKNSSSEWVCWLDSDDYFLSDINTIFDKLYSLENYDMVKIQSQWNDLVVHKVVDIAPWATITKRYLYNLKLYPELRRAEDWYWLTWIRKWYKQHKKINLNLIGYHYNFPNNNSLTAKQNEIQLDEEYIKNYLENNV